MKSTSTKKFTLAAGGAMVGLGILGAAFAQQVVPGALADTEMQVGATSTVTTAPSAPAVQQAVPQIKGPAPLPVEEQGLPG